MAARVSPSTAASQAEARVLCRAKAGAAGGSDSARAIHSCAPAASPVSAQHSTIPSEASRSTWPKPERAAVATSSRKAPAASSAYPVMRSMVATAQASQAAWNPTPCSTETSRPRAASSRASAGRPSSRLASAATMRSPAGCRSPSASSLPLSRSQAAIAVSSAPAASPVR